MSKPFRLAPRSLGGPGGRYLVWNAPSGDSRFTLIQVFEARKRNAFKVAAAFAREDITSVGCPFETFVWDRMACRGKWWFWQLVLQEDGSLIIRQLEQRGES